MTMMQYSDSGPDASRPMTVYGNGTRVRLDAITLEPVEAQRLREMGLREGASLSIIQNAQNLIVGVVACRIGLRRDLAGKLYATRMTGR